MEETKGIKEIKSYIDEDGRMVSALLHVNTSNLETYDHEIMFNGSFYVGTNLGPIQISFDFPKGYDLQQCFDDFDELSQKAIDDKNREISEENLIITPDKVKQDFELR